MEFFRKLQQKIKQGLLQELLDELRWMLRYVRRYWITVVVHIVLGVVAILMGLGTSVASKFLIDAVTGQQSGDIGGAAALMLGMLVGNIALNALTGYIEARLNIRVKNEVQAEVYQRVLDTDWQSLENFRSGDLLNRMTADVSTVAGGVTGFVPGLISRTVQFFGALGIMLYYDPTMAVIALAGVPVAVLGSRFLLRRMRKHNRRMKELSGDVMAFYEDSLANLTSIKAFDITGNFYGKMLQMQDLYKSEFLTYNLFSVRTTATISLLGMIISASCFGWGVFRLWAGVISFGSMTMFLQLASTLSGAFSALIGMVSSAVSISTSARRLMEVTQLPSETTDPDRDLRQESDLTLNIQDACFAYQNGEEVLHSIDMQAGTGDLVALTGPSGEGKTTMLRLILGLISPQKGKACLTGPMGELPLSAATRSAFAYVPQGNSMFAGTIAENLRLTAPDATDAQLEQALRAACAWDFVSQLPDGLAHKVGGRGRGLSEGQSQRLAVARALLRRAPILLLDEATSALDEATEQKMLHNLMQGGLVKTCIFVTHRTGTLRFCTRQYRVENGCLIAEPCVAEALPGGLTGTAAAAR